MRTEWAQRQWETCAGEGLKTAAELALSGLARLPYGSQAIAWASGGLMEDLRLQCSVGGMDLSNPLIVGAGWDKKGYVVDGLHEGMGFAGVEVGTVVPQPQPGNPRPRLRTDPTHSVGLNSMGFNSPGSEAVAAHLSRQRRMGTVGISLGINKDAPAIHAPEAHAAVAEKLYKYADYFAVNVSSPNTPGLRNLLDPARLTDIVQAVQQVLDAKDPRQRKPLFVKTTIDLAQPSLDGVLDLCVNRSVTGIIDTNTTTDQNLKAYYGWGALPGGLSGNDPRFRQAASDRMRYITKATKGTGLQRIGAGAINSAQAALERMEAGAQALQVVTGIREHGLRAAHRINTGLLELLIQRNIMNIQEVVGTAA
ncbi:MAG TPA: dihydroorotate dehydrogenase (quinone) [Nevskiaceae bacterium]|nr:dihydroorotate dehydrogenase (quinone) [Nevskiaceae bacterium]